MAFWAIHLLNAEAREKSCVQVNCEEAPEAKMVTRAAPRRTCSYSRQGFDALFSPACSFLECDIVHDRKSPRKRLLSYAVAARRTPSGETCGFQEPLEPELKDSHEHEPLEFIIPLLSPTNTRYQSVAWQGWAAIMSN